MTRCDLEAPRGGQAVTVFVLFLLIVLQVSTASAWFVRRGAGAGHTGSSNIRRADQLARAGVAEAMAIIQRSTNDPRWAPGTPSTQILESWFRFLRPPCSGQPRPLPSSGGVEILTFTTLALAQADGFELTSVTARPLDLDSSAVPQGVLECTVEVSTQPGRWAVRRQLTERRIFFCLDAGGQTPSRTLTVVISSTPLGRIHASL